MLAFLLVWSLGIFLPGMLARAEAARAAQAAEVARAAAIAATQPAATGAKVPTTKPAAAKKGQKTSGKATDAAPAKGNSD